MLLHHDISRHHWHRSFEPAVAARGRQLSSGEGSIADGQQLLVWSAKRTCNSRQVNQTTQRQPRPRGCQLTVSHGASLCRHRCQSTHEHLSAVVRSSAISVRSILSMVSCADVYVAQFEI